MDTQSDPITITEQGSAYVVQFAGPRLLDEVVIARSAAQLEALVRQASGPRLVLDFAAVEHMSSAALGMLITVHKQVRQRGGRLALCQVRPGIYEVFAITKLNEVFQIYHDRTQALAGLA
ncbi:MAG: STAS domain-containing protein [Planctomycetes bacterium]|nr:STAS domain-containing protein [Planctomycetota bacterium]